jgi:hypothetical protein
MKHRIDIKIELNDDGSVPPKLLAVMLKYNDGGIDLDEIIKAATESSYLPTLVLSKPEPMTH